MRPNKKTRGCDDVSAIAELKEAGFTAFDLHPLPGFLETVLDHLTVQ